VLSKDKGLFFFFDCRLWLLLLVGTSLARVAIFATIHHCQALIDRLRVQIVSKPILVSELIAQSSVPLPVSSTKHQCGEKLISDSFVGGTQFFFGGGRSICAGASQLHLVESLRDKGGSDANGSRSPVRFDCVDERDELAMVGAVIHTLFLIKCEQLFLRSDRGHHTLCFGVVRAA
jgi:hypothetical protein